MVRQLELPAEISRTTPPPSLRPFTDFFKGFESVPAVRALFGDGTTSVLDGLKVEFFTGRFAYMAVSHKDAHLIVSKWHLDNAGSRTLYLDTVHELYHVWQFKNERDSFTKGYERLVRDPKAYFRNPIEVAAYRLTVAEARRIGMTDDEIADYLRVQWVSPEDFRKFLGKLGPVDGRKAPARKVLPPVEIRRDAPVELRPFTDYFKGFEAVPGVKALFGDEAQDVLSGLRVEHVMYPLGYMGMDSEDGHLVVNSWHLRDSEISVLYLDIYLYLQYACQFLEGRWDAYEYFLQGTIAGEDPSFREYATRLVGFDGFEAFAKAATQRYFSFFDSGLAVEANKATVAEGRRIGMSEAELREYLYLPGVGMNRTIYKRFLRNVGLGLRRRTATSRRIRSGRTVTRRHK